MAGVRSVEKAEAAVDAVAPKRRPHVVSDDRPVEPAAKTATERQADGILSGL